MALARDFVFKYWLNPNGKPSKAVTDIVKWMDDQGELTALGRKAYRQLITNSKW